MSKEISATEDLYPSRIAAEPALWPRLDPVVHGGFEGVTGPLTRDQLEDYERDGFLFLPELLDRSAVEALRGELQRLRTDPEVTGRESTITEPDVESGRDEIRTVFEIHKVSPAFDALARDPRIAGMAAQLLADDIYVHQSRLNYKPGFRGKEFYWHSDFETWHVEDGMPRMRALSISIALTDNRAVNGPLMVIPGSHKHYLACVGETPEDHYKASLRKQEIGVPDDDSLAAMVEEGGIAAPTGPAGSVLVFDCNTMHGSNGNISPYPRSNAFFAFNAVSNALTAPFGARKPRPAFLAERTPQPLVPMRKAA